MSANTTPRSETPPSIDKINQLHDEYSQTSEESYKTHISKLNNMIKTITKIKPENLLNHNLAQTNLLDIDDKPSVTLPSNNKIPEPYQQKICNLLRERSIKHQELMSKVFTKRVIIGIDTTGSVMDFIEGLP